jgi:hypothetical protein
MMRLNISKMLRSGTIKRCIRRSCISYTNT